MRRGLLEEALQEACLIRYTIGSLRSRLFGSGLFHVCWDREDAHCVMVVASKCLDVERGRILSDSVTSRSGSVGRALTARDSSLRYASCALSAAQNSVPGPGPRRERHGRRARRTMRGQSNRALPPASRGRAASPLALSGTGAAPSPVIYDYVDKRDAAAVPTVHVDRRCPTCSFSICIYTISSPLTS